jgi:hypothetical protein
VVVANDSRTESVEMKPRCGELRKCSSSSEPAVPPARYRPPSSSQAAGCSAAEPLQKFLHMIGSEAAGMGSIEIVAGLPDLLRKVS